jgi:hypothetical protein
MANSNFINMKRGRVLKWNHQGDQTPGLWCGLGRRTSGPA